MNEQRRRFRPRPQKNSYRGRSNNRGPNSNGHFQSNGNISRNNGSMTNPFNVEKTVQKYEPLAKDALSSGELVLHANYLQHAEHYSRRLAELNEQKVPKKSDNNIEKTSETNEAPHKKDSI